MLPVREPDMRVVLDDVVTFSHLPERHFGLVLLGHGPLIPSGGRGKQRKRLVTKGLDCP